MAHKTFKYALMAGALAFAASNGAIAGGASASMLADTCSGCHGTDGASVGPASPTIAGNLIGTGCSAMMQINKYLLPIFDDRVVTLAVNIYNCTDTATVMLTARFIQSSIFIRKHDLT